LQYRGFEGRKDNSEIEMNQGRLPIFSTQTRWAYYFLRISLGVVFFTYGIGKFQNDYWARSIAAMSFFEHLPWSTLWSVRAIGLLEVCTGIGLMLGWRIRIWAAMAAVMLIGILCLLHFQEIRDLGLLGAAVFLYSYRGAK
jgi:uncharacterized membrane protein YphA (DoxX/SURF4 family)